MVETDGLTKMTYFCREGLCRGIPLHGLLATSSIQTPSISIYSKSQTIGQTEGISKTHHPNKTSGLPQLLHSAHYNFPPRALSSTAIVKFYSCYFFTSLSLQQLLGAWNHFKLPNRSFRTCLNIRQKKKKSKTKNLEYKTRIRDTIWHSS